MCGCSKGSRGVNKASATRGKSTRISSSKKSKFNAVPKLTPQTLAAQKRMEQVRRDALNRALKKKPS